MNQFTDPNQINVPYDIVRLPSKGLFYKNEVKEVKVTYLNASDENLLSSQNIIQSGDIIDELLKRKIVGSDIRVEEMLECDKQAVLIFLRNTSFGPSYEATYTDPKTNEKFDVTHDLSSISFKEFELTPDQNGEFEFVAPITNKTIKFKFLTSQQEKELVNLKEHYVGNQVVPTVTKRLELLIQEIDGNRDKNTLSQIIQTMPIKDSQEFRNYVVKNKPGLDLSFTVKAPSGEEFTTQVVLGATFFRPFFGI